jgi:hypothetical protein
MNAPDNAQTESPSRIRLCLWGLGIFVLGIWIFDLIMPSLGPHPEAARRTLCRNNLKMIGLALHNYHDVYGVFPPAYVSDDQGQPMHSWRVLILPYVDEQALYDQYHFDEPWDGPHNIGLLEKMPELYRCPSHADAEWGMTDYAAIVGQPCVMRGTVPVTIRDITDGTSNTIAIGESTGARIRWTEPRDVSFGTFTHIGDRDGFSGEHNGCALLLFADGSVQSLSEDEPAETVKALFTRAGGVVVPPY